MEDIHEQVQAQAQEHEQEYHQQHSDVGYYDENNIEYYQYDENGQPLQHDTQLQQQQQDYYYEQEDYEKLQQQQDEYYENELKHQQQQQQTVQQSTEVYYDEAIAVGDSGQLEIGEVASINSSGEVNFRQETESNNAISESIDLSSIGSLPEEIVETDTHRNKLVKEVISSERNYLNHLNTVIQIYLDPLRNNRPAVLETEYIVSIFSCIEKIKDLSEEVLADLVEILESGSENVGRPFLSRRTRYQDYIQYGKNHGDAIELISKLNEKKPSFVSFLQQVRDINSKKLDLPSYLIMPVQRMPRIKLLLQDILEQTEQEHVDYNDIKDALEMISSTTKILNEEIRKHENKLKVQKIQNELVGGPRIITDSRVFVREGSMMKVCRKVPKSRWFFMFSDILIYTSVSTTPNSSGSTVVGPYVNNRDAPTSYTFHRMMNLNDIKIKDLKDKENQKNAFQIISSTEKSFTVYTETPKEKNNWLEDFKLLSIKFVSENQSQNIHDLESTEVPVWVPDKEANKCMFCNDHFTVINRRHHCRNCGKVVCGSCSPGKKLLPHVKKHKPVRVCLFCFDFISMNEKKDESSPAPGGIKPASSSPQLSRSNTFQKLLDINGKKKTSESRMSGGDADGGAGASHHSGRSHSIGGTLRRLKHLAIKPSDQVKTMKEQNTKEKILAEEEKNLNRAQSEPYLITKSKVALPIVGGPPPRLMSASENGSRRSNTISMKNNTIPLTPTPPAPTTSPQSAPSASSLIQNRRSKNEGGVVLTPTPPAPTTLPPYQHQSATNISQLQSAEQQPQSNGEIAPPVPPRTSRTYSQPPPPTQPQLKAIIEQQKNPLSNSTGSSGMAGPNKPFMKPPPLRKNTPPKPITPDLNNGAPLNPTTQTPPLPTQPQRKSAENTTPTATAPIRKPPISAAKPQVSTPNQASHSGSEIIRPSNPLVNPKRTSGSEIIGGSSSGRPLPTPAPAAPVTTEAVPPPSSESRKSNSEILRPTPPFVAKRTLSTANGVDNVQPSNELNEQQQQQPPVSLPPRRNTLTKPIAPIASAPTSSDSNETTTSTTTATTASNVMPPRKLSNGPLPIRKPGAPLPTPPTTATPTPVNPTPTTTAAPTTTTTATSATKVFPSRGRPLPTPPV
ncbi:pleckstrin domain-containing protein [Heterostelium album PN500]|uniref:Pleckstrin domain-containing protein n=1 Tax=Heterostelium pallidum (strain ATCC 26659 / Pp 5 / PN500) TaxID=670386 RepID=D3BH04_HETP5|nr:pleckstrin domain-containing protein [Heterostelium album PN500]EFA79388.1 pleckstrin domain-containing protein [Heterostelium album PN500]|eukprot:XP_020431509.1 pleckstrin domain-containing protein [Heterostelium album PN500]